ncbi:Homoserine kinase [hydrothermal vent metagenome]|uniref:Homoserine kinase n=1 Tax=hydrothermal vent metagenome TaxID=652676 RepID=A0A3B0R9N2_9ZZZZ
MNTPQQATALAPASIANLAVGFDLLGQSFHGCSDRVTVSKIADNTVQLGTVSGLNCQLPTEIKSNTALRGADALLQAAGYPFGVRIDMQKGIPVSAGLGGSAASSVGAVVAVNALLPTPFLQQDLLAFALEGERASSDPPPKDNTAACLLGGLVLALPGSNNRIIRLPAPQKVRSIVFHPNLKINTGASRKTLASSNALTTTIDFAGRIAAFTHACHANDIALLRHVMQDVLIEPQRASSIPPFQAVQQAALQAGAICCSISGSGPSIFAWAEAKDWQRVSDAMQAAFVSTGISANPYDASLDSGPTQVVST